MGSSYLPVDLNAWTQSESSRIIGNAHYSRLEKNESYSGTLNHNISIS